MRGSTVVITTNNGTNYWTVTLRKGSDNSSIGTFNTSADSADSRNNKLLSVNAVSTEQAVYLEFDKVLSPGSLAERTVAVLPHHRDLTYTAA